MAVVANKILLITTKGCVACEIAVKLLDKAVKQVNNIKIITEVVDCLNPKYKEFIKLNDISDFPTMIFTQNDVVIYKHTGTTTVNQIVEEIRCRFS